MEIRSIALSSANELGCDNGGRRRCSASSRCAGVQVMVHQLYRSGRTLPANLFRAAVLGHAVGGGNLVEGLDDLALVEGAVVVAVGGAEEAVDEVDQLVERGGAVAMGVGVAHDRVGPARRGIGSTRAPEEGQEA